jgi:hypothetical protein
MVDNSNGINNNAETPDKQGKIPAGETKPQRRKKSFRLLRRRKRVYRKWRLGRLGTAALLCGVLCAVFTAGAFAAQYVWFDVLKKPGSMHQLSRNIPPHSYLRISMTYLPVTLTVYDGDEIIIDYIGETALTVEETYDYEWSVKQAEDFALSLFAPEMFGYGLTVKIPRQEYRDISISTGSGDVTVDGLIAHALTVTTRDGDIHLSDTRANTSVITRSGDIDAVFGDNIRDVGYQLMFDSNSGRLTTDFFRKALDDAAGDVLIAFGDEPLRFDAVTDSGDVTFMRGRE